MENNYLYSFSDLDNHWWRKGRRDAIYRIVNQYELPDETVIDVGCGSGSTLENFDDDIFDTLGIDINSSVVATANNKGVPAAVGEGTQIPTANNEFSLLIASDVLEHIAEPVDAIREWYRVLKPGGVAIIFVPAFQWLWSSHDEINNHHRRYTVRQLTNEVQQGGFSVDHASYWNLATSPGAVVLKILDRFKESSNAQITETSEPLNSILYRLLQLENKYVGRKYVPFGTSAYVIGLNPQ